MRVQGHKERMRILLCVVAAIVLPTSVAQEESSVRQSAFTTGCVPLTDLQNTFCQDYNKSEEVVTTKPECWHAYCSSYSGMYDGHVIRPWEEADCEEGVKGLNFKCLTSETYENNQFLDCSFGNAFPTGIKQTDEIETPRATINVDTDIDTRNAQLDVACANKFSNSMANGWRVKSVPDTGGDRIDQFSILCGCSEKNVLNQMCPAGENDKTFKNCYDLMRQRSDAYVESDYDAASGSSVLWVLLGVMMYLSMIAT